MTPLHPEAIAVTIRAAGLPDELNRWLGMTAEAAAVYERQLHRSMMRSTVPTIRRFKDRRAAELSIDAEADRLWRNWRPTRESRSNRRPRLSTFVRLVRKQRARAERDAVRLARHTTPKAKAPAAAATPEGDETMAKLKAKTRNPAKAGERKTKLDSTAGAPRIVGKLSSKTNPPRIEGSIENHPRVKDGRRQQVATFITKKPATAKTIGAEYGLLEHSVRALITGIKKPVKDGGLGLKVRAEKNDDGVTVYSIAKA